MPSTTPSLRSVAKVALGGAQVLLGSAARVRGGAPAACENPQLSCHNASVVTDFCCFNAPGGQLLQTQFWDTHPATGPVDAWTIHGLWPDHCDGTYDANCDSSRAYKNITGILQSYGADSLLSYMQTYWKDYQGDDEVFWEHEWSKHGTCISTLSPDCYTAYTPQEEVVDFFQRTVDLYASLPSYQWLADAGIVPSHTDTYTSAAIQAALTAPRGHRVTIGCKGGALNEIWYHYDVRGSVQTGDFVASDPDGMKSTCPSRGVRYLPKGPGASPTVPVTTVTGTAAPTATTTAAPFVGRGVLNVRTAGAQNGCLISLGTWYVSGTCATFTARAAGDGFTLSSHKGSCAIVDGALTCAATVASGTVFGNLGGELAVAGNSTFFADAVPKGSGQGTVYTEERATRLSVVWQGV
ncbi:ribonuclease T2-like protein [Cryomyces antarcticus]